MRFDRLFEDLEHQLASQEEAERSAVDAEAARLRVARTTLRERLAAMVDTATLGVDVGDDVILRGGVRLVGADVLLLDTAGGETRSGSAAVRIVPLAAVRAVIADGDELARSIRTPGSAPSPLVARMTLGFVLRDVARRRRSVRVLVRGGGAIDGTIDRVGGDHLDIAVHDRDLPRREASVRGYRMIPFGAVSCIHVDAWDGEGLPGL